MKHLSLKQEYLLAETPEKRLIIGMRGANVAWMRKRSAGRFPTQEFYEEFLDSFIQEEKHKLQIAKLHHITQHISKKEEREHVEAALYWSKKCVEKLSDL